MMMMNQTRPNWFILLGLSTVPHLQVLCFLVFLVMYMIILSGNFLLIIVVRSTPNLHSPMYFFLSNLSFIDICFSSTIVPALLKNTLSKDRSISILGCGFQMFFSLVLGATECILLSVMAFDRFAAICRPLHYNTIMNKKVCVCLTLVSWSMSVINALIHVTLVFQLPLCNTYHVNHFFCEVPPFLRLSCKDPWLNEIAMYIAAGIIAVCAFFLTLVSYIHIISTILKIRSSNGRQKAFSTCTSHLTVVTLYYGTIMIVYFQPRSSFSPETNNSVSVLYTVVTPMLNPIIYSIRNKDVKNSILNHVNKKVISPYNLMK
ncbi:olfactory receptor-like protein OLF1 [Phyllobates terribilis]|uniref:olfactory receptor-like protein OLF1 n=1 Tax=Phyllobates terribilis TaxID=111132 RepID=UPI003CCAA51D